MAAMLRSIIERVCSCEGMERGYAALHFASEVFKKENSGRIAIAPRRGFARHRGGVFHARSVAAPHARWPRGLLMLGRCYHPLHAGSTRWRAALGQMLHHCIGTMLESTRLAQPLSASHDMGLISI